MQVLHFIKQFDSQICLAKQSSVLNSVLFHSQQGGRLGRSLTVEGRGPF